MANWASGQARNFSNAFNYEKSAPNFLYIRDPNVSWTGPNGQVFTGGWRALNPSDLAANISVSGLSLNVGAVAVTGNPLVTISNPILAVSGNFGNGGGGLITGGGGFIGITGTVATSNAAESALLSNISSQLSGALNVTGIF